MHIFLFHSTLITSAAYVIIYQLSQKEIEESLDLLQKDWDVDPILRNFMLGKITDVSDYPIKVKDVVFHVPYLNSEKKYILWKEKEREKRTSS